MPDRTPSSPSSAAVERLGKITESLTSTRSSDVVRFDPNATELPRRRELPTITGAPEGAYVTASP